jgi:hypothetical protein
VGPNAGVFYLLFSFFRRGRGEGGSASVEKNKGIGFTELVGAVVGGVGRSMLL